MLGYNGDAGASVLRESYAVSGTDLADQEGHMCAPWTVTANGQVSSAMAYALATRSPVPTYACYAVRGTGQRPICYADAMRCPILTARYWFWGYQEIHSGDNVLYNSMESMLILHLYFVTDGQIWFRYNPLSHCYFSTPVLHTICLSSARDIRLPILSRGNSTSHRT
eukprot:493978-Rhodomonas_salina.3